MSKNTAVCRKAAVKQTFQAASFKSQDLLKAFMFVFYPRFCDDKNISQFVSSVLVLMEFELQTDSSSCSDAPVSLLLLQINATWFDSFCSRFLEHRVLFCSFNHFVSFHFRLQILRTKFLKTLKPAVFF